MFAVSIIVYLTAAVAVGCSVSPCYVICAVILAKYLTCSCEAWFGNSCSCTEDSKKHSYCCEFPERFFHSYQVLYIKFKAYIFTLCAILYIYTQKLSIVNVAKLNYDVETQKLIWNREVLNDMQNQPFKKPLSILCCRRFIIMHKQSLKKLTKVLKFI